MKTKPASPPSTLLLAFWPGLIAALLLLGGAISSATAATNLGLYVYGQNPHLIANYGNPTWNPDLRPPPAIMDLGSVGTYFHGTRTVSIVETQQSTYTGSQPRWAGPGDSWSSYSLTSPTPGSTRQTPIVLRLDSRITNANSAVGYWVDAGLGSYWFFDQPTTNVHFRVDWSITYVGEPFIERRCRFVPPFQTICEDVSVTSTGAFNASISIEGFGGRVLSPPPGGTAALTSGTTTGSFSGIAIASHLIVNFGAKFYEGQTTRGDGRIIVEVRLYADVTPLADPQLRISRRPDERLEIGWPAGATGYVLQVATGPNAGDWTPVPETPVIVGDEKVLTWLPGEHGQFFRLYQP